MIVKNFEESDLDNFKCRDLREGESYRHSLESIPSVSIMDGKHTVAIFGLRPVHDGVAEGFLFASDLIKTRIKGFQEIAKQLPELAIKTYNLHRLEVIFEKKNRRWGETLGLKYESTLKKFSEDGEDAYMYVRIN